MALLDIEDLHVYYGHIHALRGISLAVEEGEIVAMLGSNGAGKTTTLRTISGIQRGRQGYIRLAGAGIRDDMELALTLFPRLRERISQTAGTLSGGEQQMLAIGRAMMTRPRILL